MEHNISGIIYLDLSYYPDTQRSGKNVLVCVYDWNDVQDVDTGFRLDGSSDKAALKPFYWIACIPIKQVTN